jgi:hypothetical protein
MSEDINEEMLKTYTCTYNGSSGVDMWLYVSDEQRIKIQAYGYSVDFSFNKSKICGQIMFDPQQVISEIPVHADKIVTFAANEYGYMFKLEFHDINFDSARTTFTAGSRVPWALVSTEQISPESKTCECGSSKCGSPMHSEWCPLYSREIADSLSQTIEYK